MSERPIMPPGFRLELLPADADPLAAAEAAGRGGAEEATVFWAERADRLELAVLLFPDEPRPRAARTLHLVAVALCDCLGALIPPAVPLHLRWPDRVQLDGALAGGLRLAMADGPEDAAPDWVAAAITLVLDRGPSPGEPGREPDRTSFAEQGCGDLTAVQLTERVTRHLLSWIDQYGSDGFAPVAEAWCGRAEGYREEVNWRLGERRIRGKLLGLDEEGGLLMAARGRHRVLPLAAAIARPTWRL